MTNRVKKKTPFGNAVFCQSSARVASSWRSSVSQPVFSSFLDGLGSVLDIWGSSQVVDIDSEGVEPTWKNWHKFEFGFDSDRACLHEDGQRALDSLRDELQSIWSQGLPTERSGRW